MLACCGTDNVDMLQLLIGEYKMNPNDKDLVRADTASTACTAGSLPLSCCQQPAYIGYLTLL